MTEFEGLELLRQSQADHSFQVAVTVTSCAYSCCGKGWRRKDGYEQEYVGWIDKLDEAEPGTFMLYSAGIGTISYVIACRFYEVADVQPAG